MRKLFIFGVVILVAVASIAPLGAELLLLVFMVCLYTVLFGKIAEETFKQ